jgi:Fe-S cluster biogenesis protein NfuA
MENINKEDYRERILNVLEMVRPYLNADGGDIEFVGLLDDLTVQVVLTGACHSCSMSIQTLKFGVEQAIKSAIPEIKEVVAINY